MTKDLEEIRRSYRLLLNKLHLNSLAKKNFLKYVIDMNSNFIISFRLINQ
jgi:hypothetical protein